MRSRNCLLLIIRDIQNKWKSYLQFVWGIVFVVGILMIHSVIVQIVDNYYSETIYGKAEENSLYTALEITSQGDFSETAKVLKKELEEIPHMASMTVSANIDVPATSGQAEYAYINLNRVILQTAETTYQGLQDSSFDFGRKKNEKVKLEIQFCLDGTEPFSQDMLKAFSYYYPKNDFILAGEITKNPGELVISDYMLKKFGITNYKEVLGEKVTFLIDGKEYLKDYIVTAVINSNFFRVTQHYAIPQITIFGEARETADLGLNMLFCYGSVDEAENAPKVYQHIKEHELTESILYDESTSYTFYYTKQIKKLVHNIVVFVTFFILIAIVLNIVSTISTQIRSSASYYGMLRAMGINGKELFIIYIVKQFILIICACLIAIFYAGILLLVINICLQLFVSETFLVREMQFLVTALKSMLFTSVLLCGISTFLYARNMKKPISMMLKKEF